MTLHYPLLVAADSQVAGEDLYVGSNGACVTVDEPDTTFAFDPSDYISGLQDGDFVVVVAVGTGITQGQGVMVASDWTYVTGPCPDAVTAIRYSTVLFKFWDSGNPESTMTPYRFGSSATVCFKIYAFRGVSHVKPFDIRASRAGSPHTTAQPASMLWPAARLHSLGTEGGITLNVCFYEDPGGFAGAMIPHEVERVVTTGDVLAFQHTEAGIAHATTVLVRHSADSLRNVLGSSVILGQTNPGWTLSGMEWDSPGSEQDFNRDNYYADNTIEDKNLNATIDADVGDTIVVTLAFECFGSASSADSAMVLAIEDPSGNTAAQGFDAGGVTTAWNAEFDAVLNHACVSPDSVGQRVVEATVFFEAAEAGTYSLRAYVTEEGEDLEWQATTSPTSTSTLRVRYLHGGAAINTPPFVLGTFSAQASAFGLDDFASPVLFAIDKDDAEYDDSWAPSGEYAQYVYEIIPSGATLKPTRLVSYACPGAQYVDSDQLSLASSNQCYGLAAGALVISDSAVWPTYRTSEEGSDIAGQYYFEVTLNESPSSSFDWQLGLLQGQVTETSAGSLLNSTFTEALAIMLTGNGQHRTYGSDTEDLGSLSANDVIGFAIDYDAGELGLYYNGSLIRTVTLADAPRGATLHTRSGFRAFHRPNQSASDINTVTFNFTGPFTYAKPSGFVAWDWHSEVA